MERAGRIRRAVRALCCSGPLFAAACATTSAATSAATNAATNAAHKPDTAGVEAFNRALTDVTTRMDNAGLAALWEEDGVSLLPATPPLLGRRAILAMVEGMTNKYPGARMLLFEMTCAGIEVAGDLAHEHCEEHQRVDLGTGQPPFEGWGKMLLVLHRGEGGAWRLRREMWNEGIARR